MSSFGLLWRCYTGICLEAVRTTNTLSQDNRQILKDSYEGVRYNIWDYRVFGLRPSFDIQNNRMFRELDLYLSWGEQMGDIYSVGSVRQLDNLFSMTNITAKYIILFR
jgi:hypothetical protein